MITEEIKNMENIAKKDHWKQIKKQILLRGCWKDYTSANSEIWSDFKKCCTYLIDDQKQIFLNKIFL